MPQSPVSTRTLPSRRFENYILMKTLEKGPGLCEVPDNAFLRFSGPASQAAAGAVSGATYAVPQQIGFDFSFDGTVYKKAIVSLCGWIILQDPTDTDQSGATAVTSCMSNAGGNVNGQIKSTFTSNSYLLAPWFDVMRNPAEDANQLKSLSLVSAAKAERMNYGLEPLQPNMNTSFYGARWYSDSKGPNGRRFIVRWNSNVTLGFVPSNIKFECILYENGKIEYRYAPSNTLTVTDYGPPNPSASFYEGAASGIWAPGSANRFRDFTPLYGYREAWRQTYKYGGCSYTNTYSDTGNAGTGSSNLTVPYSIGLTVVNNWPARGDMGAVVTFLPPQNRKVVLPRANVSDRANYQTYASQMITGDDPFGDPQTYYDDRKSVLYGSASVVTNFPVRLNRLYGDATAGIVERQSLFAGDFDVTSSVSKTSDPFVNVPVQRFRPPFNEVRRYSMDAASFSDTFFATGSNVSQFGPALETPLKSKTQVNVTLPINAVITMHPSSSIYYYNSRVKSWNIPQKSSYVVFATSTSPPPFNVNGDIRSPNVDTPLGRVPEDQRGFGPIGNTVSSGTFNPNAVGVQTDYYINSDFNFSSSNYTNAMSRAYANSVQLNPKYQPNPEETFSIPINEPFLLEKAVIEVPISAGPSWFNQRTTNMLPLETQFNSFDFGGPALTVSLFNLVKIGDSGQTRLDLILTGTVTHTFDSSSNLVMSSFSPTTNQIQLRPQGFLAYASTPAAVVSPNTPGNNMFTGSFVAKCEALVSNGVVVKLMRDMSLGSTTNNRQAIRDLLAQPVLSLVTTPGSNFAQSASMAYINPYGRSGGGFESSSRSVFGKDRASFMSSVGSPNKVPNPFYVSGSNPNQTGAASGLPTQFELAIASAGTTFRASAAVPLIKHIPSPYLVYPGDRLVLAISKVRPVAYGTAATGAGGISGSWNITDNVRLLTGSIGISLYGSMIREETDIGHVTYGSVGTNSVHSIAAGGELLTDRTEGMYYDSFIGTSVDNYVTGSLVTKTTTSGGRVALVTGSRGKVFGIQSARNTPMPSVSANQENITNPSYAFRLQPWWERASTTTSATKSVCYGERVYDSMMPSISDCFTKNGQGFIVLSSNTVIGQYGNVQKTVPQNPDGTFNYGFTLFDADTGENFTNMLWNFSYPFEPKYSGVSRQLNLASSFIATKGFGPSYALPIDIPPVPVAGLLLGENAKGTGRDSLGTYPNINCQYWLADVNIAAKNSNNFFTTGSASSDQTSMALFGFGDKNTYYTNSGNGPNGFFFGGTNHGWDFRSYETPVPVGGNLCTSYYTYGVMIRGWRYGVFSGIPSYTQAYFRKGKYGMPRDMLEQRLFVKSYMINDPNYPNDSGSGVTDSPLTVRFVNTDGNVVDPALTWSNNLSLEATSSLPYLDGTSRDRPPVFVNSLRQTVVKVSADPFGNPLI